MIVSGTTPYLHGILVWVYYAISIHGGLVGVSGGLSPTRDCINLDYTHVIEMSGTF